MRRETGNHLITGSLSHKLKIKSNFGLNTLHTTNLLENSDFSNLNLNNTNWQP